MDWLISDNLNDSGFPGGWGYSRYKLYGYGYKYKLYGYGEIKTFCSMHNRVFFTKQGIDHYTRRVLNRIAIFGVYTLQQGDKMQLNIVWY